MLKCLFLNLLVVDLDLDRKCRRGDVVSKHLCVKIAYRTNRMGTV